MSDGQLSVYDVLAGRLPDFDGRTYERERDHIRLGRQALAVWEILRDEQWHTLRELSETTGYPEASISARIRDLRKAKFGGKTVERDYLDNGLWRYRLLLDEGGSAADKHEGGRSRQIGA